MLKFIAAKDVAEQHAIDLARPKNKPVTGAMLGDLTMLVLNRFIEQVDWDAITEMYLAGLVDGEDLALIQRAVKALVDGGIEYVGINGD